LLLGLVTEIERPTRGTGSNGLTMFVSASKPFLDGIKRGSEYTRPHDSSGFAFSIDRKPDARINLTYDLQGVFRRAVVGTSSPGLITWADKSVCGKSFGFSVTMKSARPASAQPPSPRSGEMFGRAEAETGSASSRKQIDYLPDEVAPYAKLSLNKDALVGIDGTIPPG
jgi:hypothetical protein